MAGSGLIVSPSTTGVEHALVTAASGVESTVSKVAATSGDILTGYLIKALEKTGNLVDKSVDMVMEQAPLLVQEMLRWYFAYNLILFISAIVLGIVLYTGAYKLAKHFWKESDGISGFTAAVVCAFGTLPLIAMFNLEWLKIYIAPRLWLIEYTANLLKHSGQH